MKKRMVQEILCLLTALLLVAGIFSGAAEANQGEYDFWGLMATGGAHLPADAEHEGNSYFAGGGFTHMRMMELATSGWSLEGDYLAGTKKDDAERGQVRGSAHFGMILFTLGPTVSHTFGDGEQTTALGFNLNFVLPLIPKSETNRTHGLIDIVFRGDYPVWRKDNTRSPFYQAGLQFAIGKGGRKVPTDTY